MKTPVSPSIAGDRLYGDVMSPSSMVSPMQTIVSGEAGDTAKEKLVKI